MAKSTSESGSKRGRPPSFCHEEVLEKLVFLFWKKGFECTSYDDIRKASSLSVSSLQHTFGSKHEIFVAVLDHYYGMTEALIAPLRDGQGLTAIIDWFQFMKSKIGEQSVPTGCLMVHTMSQQVGQETDIRACTGRYTERLRDLLSQALSDVGPSVRTTPEMVASRVALIESTYLGIFTVNRSEQTPKRAMEMIDSVVELLDSWR